ncbi:DsbA family protein [Pontixanthobacter sp.]|uniref:DsbA family protein n=1 Tax=Pontixanthobacter sp. TaxID=2792078 RepID=UPI003C7B9219
MMRHTALGRISAVTIIAALSIAAINNWNINVVQTDRAMVVGKDDAPVTLTEFVSYTCPHCATFEKDSEAVLQLAYVGPGNLKRDVRSIIRNPVDLAVTMLAQCGDSSKFVQNHTMFMARQPVWLEKGRNSTAAQRAMWSRGDAASRRLMASALGFYEMMEMRGYSRIEVDSCLNDDTRVPVLLANTEADFAEFGISGTPSFAIDGAALEGVHSWQALGPLLEAKY